MKRISMKRIEGSTWEIIFLFFLLFHQGIQGQNPIIKDIGMSDPHIRVFRDTVYLYCGHDSGPDDRTWVMGDWRVFSTTDLVNWKFEATISPRDNYMDDNSTDCWAGDAATRNGQYFFYFSDRKRGIGVMRSGSPRGPFRDALGKPLLSPMHDPTILAEDPQPIEIRGEQWEKAPEWMDKNYIFQYNGVYYLSWGRDYAVSEHVYGPYDCAGVVGNGHQLSEYAHGSFFWWKGQFYHIWCYYLRQGFKYRESIITYCHFDESSAIFTDTEFLDKHFATGVGQYDASWPEIQAEWYYEVSSGIIKQGSRKDGFVLTGIRDGSWLRYANVDFRKPLGSFEAAVSHAGGDGEIEIRSGGRDGKRLGTIPCRSSAGRNQSRIVSCRLDNGTGLQDLFLTFSGDENCSFELDWFRFQE